MAAEATRRVPVTLRKMRVPMSVVMAAPAIVGLMMIVVTCVLMTVAVMAPMPSRPRAHQATAVEGMETVHSAITATMAPATMPAAAATARQRIRARQHEADKAGHGDEECGAGHVRLDVRREFVGNSAKYAHCLPIRLDTQCATGRNG